MVGGIAIAIVGAFVLLGVALFFFLMRRPREIPTYNYAQNPNSPQPTNLVYPQDKRYTGYAAPGSE